MPSRRLVVSSRLRVAAIGLLCLAAFGSVARAAVVTKSYGPFSVSFYNNGDTFIDAYNSSYTGTSDWTATQMSDIAAALSTWTANIGNKPGRQINMTAIWTGLEGNTLGGSSSLWYGDDANAYTASEIVWREGYNLSTSRSYDTYIVYDTDAAGFGWNFGSGKPSSSTIDFRSVVTHEIGHSLGMSSTYYSDTDQFWGISTWDSFLVDQNGVMPKAGTTGVTASGVAADFDQLGNVYFTGANAVAANGGKPVAIYAPDAFESGSSLSHLDDSTFPTVLMKHAISLGQSIREPSNVELAMMQDMGWTIVPGTGYLGHASRYGHIAVLLAVSR